MIKDYNEDGTYRYTNINDVLSYNAPFNFINTVRGTGKSLGCKIRAYKRFIRHGKGVVWVRRIEEDTIRTRSTFLNQKFFKFTGATPEQVRIRGNYAEVKIGTTWERFVEFVTLSKKSSERSADDSRYDLFLLDEGFVNQQKRNMYRGDEVTDFFDLYDSKRRGDKMQALILGNRESVTNPYLSYFGIEAPPFDFNGIITYREGTIAYMQRTTPPPDVTEQDDKIRKALTGTKYGDFKYNGVAKDFDFVHIQTKPNEAHVYCSFDFGFPVTAWYYAGRIYWTAGIDKDRTIITLKATNYKKSFIYTPKEKSRFTALINAKKRNEIFYSDIATAEIASNVIKVLQI